MNEREVIASLTSHSKTRPFFMGVLARNELRKKLLPGQFIVANTGHREDRGEHWVTIFRQKNGTLLYADSLAMVPSHPEFFDYLTHFHNEQVFHFNTKALQSLLSQRCGEFSIVIAYELCCGKSLPQIRAQYCSKHLEINDCIVVSKYRQVFGYLHGMQGI